MSLIPSVFLIASLLSPMRIDSVETDSLLCPGSDHWTELDRSADPEAENYYPMGPMKNPYAYCQPRSVMAGLNLHW